MAQRFALGGNPKPRAGLSERHRKERKAHGLHDGELPTRLSGPEWGLFLGPGYLYAMPRQRIESSGVFAIVKQVGDRALFVGVTSEPMDALSDGFESKLDRVR